MQWPDSFYALKRGEGCPMCAEGRPDDNGYGLRILAGEVADAYLQRAGIQRGYTVLVWRSRHVAEPTELSDEDATAWSLEVLRVGRALETHFKPVKLNYDTLGNSMPHLHTHVIPRYAEDPKARLALPVPGGRPTAAPGGRVPGRRRSAPSAARLDPPRRAPGAG